MHVTTGPMNWFDRIYADRAPIYQMRARGMFGIYAICLVAVSIIFLTDMASVLDNKLTLATVYLGLLTCLGGGLGLVLTGRDELATHAVSASFVVFSLATLLVGMQGRPDLYFSGWSKWYAVFIVIHGLFLERRGALFVAVTAAVWAVAYYALFASTVAGTPNEILTSDVVDTVAVVVVVGGITFALVGAVQSALATSREALQREQDTNQALEKLVAVRTREVEDGLAERQMIIDHMSDGLVAVGADGRLRVVNARVSELLETKDLERDQTGSRMLGRLFPLLARVADTGDVDAIELSTPSGRIVKVTASPVPGDEGAAVVALVRDVTLDKEVDRLKTEFISTVSHELRTPLTSVLGFSKMVRDRLDKRVAHAVDPEDERANKELRNALENLGIVVSEGERLTALINDVLDIAKMEAGRVEWRMEPVDIGGLVKQAAAAVSGLFPEDRGVQLEVDVADDLGTVTGDAHRLVQVMVNLLSNASKFTLDGTVRITASADGDGVRVAVEDTGRGIPESEFPYIFERFRQVDDTLTDKPQGTGLGLPICRQILAAHGATIDVSSTVAQGSRFWFRLS